MAFTSLEDARNKVTNPELDESSVILYASNGLLDSTTIFYTNQEMTTLAPAGNYVVPSPQFKSYYVTLGSDGKIVGSKQNLLLSTTDASWVNDYIQWYVNGGLAPSDYYGNFRDGTAINISNDHITDLYWVYPNPDNRYPHPKKWQIDYGDLNDTPMTNIDLSDMKGYDLKITTGEWYGNYFNSCANFIPGFTGRNFTTPIVHLGADPNRATVVGDLQYYFRPDYFYPKYDINYESGFRRLPDYLPIYDENNVEKRFMTLHNPLLDVVVKNSGRWSPEPRISRTFRTSTRESKGMTLLNQAHFKNFVNGDPGNPGYYMQKEPNGASSDNIYQVVPYNNKHLLTSDAWIISSSEFVRGVTINDPTNEAVSYICALILSLVVPVEERDTWTISVFGQGTKTYAQINPYQWTTVPYEGSYNYVAPATNFLNFFNPSGGSVNPINLSHALSIQFDFEYVATYGRDSLQIGQVYQKLYDNCYAWSVANNWPSQGAVIPKFANYAEGIYKTEYESAPGYGWRDVLDKTISEVKSTVLFDDYKNYYLNGTKPYSQVPYHKFYEAVVNSYDMFFVTNYVRQNQPYWILYALIHNYDITKKLLSEFLTTEELKSKRVMGYGYNFQEPNCSDFYYARIGVESGAMITYKPNTAPSFNQSLAVWSMAYADGFYIWDDPPVVGGEYTYEYIQSGIYPYLWGNLNQINNGMFDWFSVGIWQVMQNKDIVGANTFWQRPQLYWNGAWTSDTDTNSTNIPVMLAQAKAPISAYKLSADGTQALLIITYPYNNGYTKSTHTIRLQTVTGTPQFTVDTWGQYTSVIRINLT